MTNFKYLFVVGAPRSGTTWLHQLLLSHPDAIGGQESHFFATFGRVLHDFDHKLHQHRPHGLAGYCRRDELIEHIRNHWAELTGPFAEFKPAATLFVDKTPDHAVWLDAIAEILPEARVLHMHRDARAVVASLLRASRQDWGRGWAPRSVASATARWLEYVQAAEAFGQRHPQRFARCSYEALQSNLEHSLRELLPMVGLSATDPIVDHMLSTQRADPSASDSSGYPMRGELAPASPPEPMGFYGPATVDSLRGELNFWSRHMVWRRTAETMRDLGYQR